MNLNIANLLTAVVLIGIASIALWVIARRRPRARTATLRDRISEAARSNAYYLGETANGTALVEHRDLISLLIVGDPRTGKTTMLLSLMIQAVLGYGRRRVIIFVDLKGTGPECCRTMWSLANTVPGWRFWYVSPEHEYSHPFNLITNLASASSNEADFAESLSLGLKIGVGLGHEYFTGTAKQAIRAILRDHPQARSFRAFANALADRPQREAQDLAGLRDACEELAGIPSLNWIPPHPGAERQGLDLVRELQTGNSLIYFRLGRLTHVSRTLLRLVRDAAAAVNSNRATASRTEVILIVDECHRIANDEYLVELAALARDLLVRLWLTCQNLSQPARVSRALAHAMFSMPSLYFGSSDSFTNELYRNSSTDEWLVHTHSPRGFTTSYHAMPTLVSHDLEALVTAPQQGKFLARLPSSRWNPLLTYAWAQYPHTVSQYEDLRSRGFFDREGELPGAVLNPKFRFFDNGVRLRQENRTGPRASVTHPDTASALRAAARRQQSEE